MGFFSKIFGLTVSAGIENLRNCLVELEGLKRITLEKALEFKEIQSNWEPYQEDVDRAIEKGEASKSLLSLKERYDNTVQNFKKTLQELSDKQAELRKGVINQLIDKPALLPLLFADDFLSKSKYDELVCCLVKAHKEGKVSDSQLKKIVKYSEKQLTEEDKVYVKDDRTQYADVIIVDDENKILFVIRNKNDDFCPAGYCLPGGHIEEGETPREAAQRELNEETSIEVELHELLPCGEYIDNKSHIYYFCVHSSIEPVCLQEEEQQQWEKVPYDEIGTKPLIMNLQNNLEHLIAIPRTVLNKEADNAQKVYFDCKTFRKGAENLPYLKRLESSCAIVKANGQCWVYAQNNTLESDLEKARKSTLVPKKMFITRSGKTFLTTVWIDPTSGSIVEEKPDSVEVEYIGADIAVGDGVQVKTVRGWREGIVECCIKTKEGAYIGLRTKEGKYTEAYLKSIKALKKVSGTVAEGTTSTPPKELKTGLEDISELDFSSLPKLGGSSETFLYEVGGKKIFVKKEREGKMGQLQSEVIADAVYNALGFRAPVSVFHTIKDSKTGEVYGCKLNEFIEYRELGSVSGLMTKSKAFAEIKKGFALDCLLANWDVIGANKDNILVGPEGQVVRIDNGSAFQFRAKGSRKADSDFFYSTSVVELDSMRTGAKAADSVKEVFGKLTDKEVVDQIDALIAKSPIIMETLRSAGAETSVIGAIGNRLSYMKTWADKKKLEWAEAEAKKSVWDGEPIDPEMVSKVTEKYFSDWDSFVLEGNKSLKTTLKEGILEVERRRTKGYTAVAESMDLSLGEYKAKMQDLAERFVAATTPGIVLHTSGEHEAFSKVFAPAGRFKSLFETKTGCGCTKLSARSNYEHKVFGFVDDTSAQREKRPIYGCAASNRRGFYGGFAIRSAEGYGDVFVEVKREKALRAATITTGDSLNSERTYFPVPFGKPHFTMFSGLDTGEAKKIIQSIEDYIEDSKAMEPQGAKISGQGSYLEMQYHNQLTQDDVDTIHFVLGFGKKTDLSITSAMQNLLHSAASGGKEHKVELYVKRK